MIFIISNLALITFGWLFLSNVEWHFFFILIAYVACVLEVVKYFVVDIASGLSFMILIIIFNNV